ncbi:tRNA (N(6)-L-threonylcarbamoyladenosine(37)-C(2))-methylthiotransferase MtaB [Alicyclobacillaceae bacterium I2511]|nr:tRNA (N(6)-L-threonylcarbamoyladenosine(37)-C(2))-methylthiotransferase MtaB [Alicyclobacillaceae bacterium I2511]
MSTVAFHTLGCKVNFYDTEGIWQTFRAAGYEQVSFEAQADVYVINTCTVTHTGDHKSRQMIRRAVRRNPQAVVVVTGCYAQISSEQVARIAGVDLVVGNDRKTEIVQRVAEVLQEQHPDVQQSVGNILKAKDFEEMDVSSFSDRKRANLKIQDGCNNFCTFCIIPYARGLIRSRKPEHIVAQASKLAMAGYREIILTGIHTGGYGADLQGYRLADLIQELEKIPEIYRLRISSIEASEIDERLIDVLGRSQKVCRHLHIPLQAGHNQILKHMNRHYTVEQFADKLTRLRSALPNVAITSDVIVGFPGETDEYFTESTRFIEEQRFSQLHVFPYSPRQGTPAAQFPDQIPETEKEHRVSQLLQVSKSLTANYAVQFIRKTLQVIPEELFFPEDAEDIFIRDFGMWDNLDVDLKTWLIGHADNYLRVAFPLPLGVSLQSLLGEVCVVEVKQSNWNVQLGQMTGQVTQHEIFKA